MMNLNEAVWTDKNTQRMSLGAFGALAVHVVILMWFSLPVSKNIISADLYSPPTNVTIRFFKPIEKITVVKKDAAEIKKPTPVKRIQPKAKQKIVKTAPAKPQPEVLNIIEPAAAATSMPMLTEAKFVEPIKTAPVKHAKQSIPVVTEVNLKGRRIHPQYPKRALRLKQEGTVLLRVLVSTEGQQEELTVHRPSQYALLNQAAVKAVRKWKFKPTRRGGTPVKSWVEIPIEFAIQ